MNFAKFCAIYLFLAIADFVNDIVHKRYAKKCKFNCDKCKNWDCMYFYCNSERNKLNEENKNTVQ